MKTHVTGCSTLGGWLYHVYMYMYMRGIYIYIYIFIHICNLCVYIYIYVSSIYRYQVSIMIFSYMWARIGLFRTQQTLGNDDTWMDDIFKKRLLSGGWVSRGQSWEAQVAASSPRKFTHHFWDLQIIWIFFRNSFSKTWTLDNKFGPNVVFEAAKHLITWDNHRISTAWFSGLHSGAASVAHGGPFAYLLVAEPPPAAWHGIQWGSGLMKNGIQHGNSWYICVYIYICWYDSY